MKPYLVIDNHRAHKAWRVEEFLNKHFNVIWMPAASCEFNSIESVWSMMKNKFRRVIAQRVGKIKSQQQLVQNVMEVVNSFDDN